MSKGIEIRQDFTSLQSITIWPHTQVEVWTRLPSGAGGFHDDVSTTSRSAQVGLEIAKSSAKRTIPDTLVYDRKHPGWKAKVKVRTLGERPLEIRNGLPLCSAYRKMDEALQGKALLEAIYDKRIVIDGKKGQAWDWKYKHNGPKTPDNIRGIIFRLNPAFQKWIAPPDEPIDLYDLSTCDSDDYRLKLNDYLEEVPENENPCLWIGETECLTLKGVTGLFRRNVLGGDEEASRHSNSLLIKPGKEWPIRSEIYGPTTKERIATHVVMEVYGN